MVRGCGWGFPGAPGFPYLAAALPPPPHPGGVFFQKYPSRIARVLLDLRVLGCPRTHLGGHGGLQAGKGGLSQCSRPRPAPPSRQKLPARAPRVGTRHSPLVTAIAQMSFYMPHASRENQPGREFQIQEKNYKLA